MLATCKRQAESDSVTVFMYHSSYDGEPDVSVGRTYENRTGSKLVFGLPD